MQIYESPPTKMVAPLHKYDGNLLHKKELFQQKIKNMSSSNLSRTQVNFQTVSYEDMPEESQEGPLNINLPSSISQSMTDEHKAGINLFKSAAFRCGIEKLNKSAVPFGKSKMAQTSEYYKIKMFTPEASPDIQKKFLK